MEMVSLLSRLISPQQSLQLRRHEYLEGWHVRFPGDLTGKGLRQATGLVRDNCSALSVKELPRGRKQAWWPWQTSASANCVASDKSLCLSEPSLEFFFNASKGLRIPPALLFPPTMGHLPGRAEPKRAYLKKILLSPKQ